MWDARKKGVIHTFQSMYQVTAVAFSDTAEQVFSGGIDNDIKVRVVWILPIMWKLFSVTPLTIHTSVWILEHFYTQEGERTHAE